MLTDLFSLEAGFHHLMFFTPVSLRVGQASHKWQLPLELLLFTDFLGQLLKRV